MFSFFVGREMKVYLCKVHTCYLTCLIKLYFPYKHHQDDKLALDKDKAEQVPDQGKFKDKILQCDNPAEIQVQFATV